MNNKKGGFGAKLLLVLILMVASAVGGAYGYRVLDGKMAVRDAQKVVDAVKVSEYDTEEAVQIEGFKEEASKNLDTATTRKEVYEIMDSFNEDVDKILTKTEKELEEARRAVNDARNSNKNNNSSNDGNNNNNSTYDNNNDFGNDSSDIDDGSDESKSSNGILGNLFGKSSDQSEDETSSEDDGDVFN